jgi:hypothetical protein
MADIQSITSKPFAALTKKELRALYWQHKKSQLAIAEMFGVPERMARRAFKTKGIRLRTRSEINLLKPARGTTRDRNKREGRCVRCGRRPDSGRRHCWRCRRFKKCLYVAWKNRILSSGRCFRCRGRKGKGHWCCAKCRSRICRIRTKRYRRLVNAGRCLRCGKVHKDGGTTCKVCISKIALMVKARIKRRRRKQLCTSCGAARPPFRSVCVRCWFGRIAATNLRCYGRRDELYELFKSQKGKCAYTGRRLIPGKNTSLDHKMPRSRRGSHKAENLHFVHKKINTIKRDLSHEEFIGLCRQIAERTTGTHVPVRLGGKWGWEA